MKAFLLKIRLGCLTGAICLFVTSCGQGDDVPAEPPVTRTLLVYMAGDNNLSDETARKIESLRDAWNHPNGRLLIYCDDSSRTPRLLEVSTDGRGNNEMAVVREYADSNSADAGVLAGVLETMLRDYQALSYGLIVFSHSSGWLPEGTLLHPWKQPVQTRSVVKDGHREMNLVDFAAVIPDGLFDFIVFESCLMAGIEVVYELRHKTDFIVASSAEMLSPGLTPLYHEIIPLLMEPRAGLVAMAQRYFEHYNAQTGDLRSATISVIRTEALEALRDAAGCTLTGAMTGDLLSIQQYDRFAYRLFFDFGDAYLRVLDRQSFDRLQERLNACIVFKAATPAFIPGQRGFTVRCFSGLTLYIEQVEFPFLNEQYRKLEWYRSLSP